MAAVNCILVGQTPQVLDGVSSNVQQQLNDKENKINTVGILQRKDTGEIVAAEEIELDSFGFAKKVVPSVDGNLAALDINGNIIDSGKQSSDFAETNNVYTKGEVDTALAGKQPAGSYAAANHNHSGIYQPVGNYIVRVGWDSSRGILNLEG